jgi:hypothetical protein
MTPENPLERLLEQAAQYLSQALAALENFFSILTHWLGRAVVRTTRFIWRQLRLGLKNLRYLFGLSWAFLALVWIASGFHELTFNKSWIAKIFGWTGIGFVGLVTIGAIVAMLSPTLLEKRTPKATFTFRFTLVHFIALFSVVAATHLHYQFRSRVLRWTQCSFLSVKAGFVSLQIHGPGIRWNAWPWSENQQASSPHSVSTPYVTVSVRSKGSGDANWDRALDDEITQNTQLNLWVEKIRLTDTATIVDVAVKTWNASTQANLKKATTAYFVDDAGNKYELTEDKGDYPVAEEHFSDSIPVHVCKGDEIYRFQLLFPKLTHPSGLIYLHHPQFERLEIDLDWTNATSEITR